MGTFTENDYKKMSEAVADDLIQSKIPLNDSIKKLASAHDLNQEQVGRLCEATNNVTFNKMFQSRDKTAEDRIIDFDIANPKAILSESIKEASVYEEDPGAAISLSEFRPLRDSVGHSFEKAAEDAVALAAEPTVSREKAERTARKTHAYLKNEKIAAEMLYEDALVNVRNQFKRLYADLTFDKFEKQAAALYKDAAVKPLTDLRRLLRLPEVTYDFARLEKTAGVVDDSGIVFKLFSDAVDSSQKINVLDRGISKLAGYLP